MNQIESPRLLQNADVCRKVKLSRASIYRAVKRGDFPAPVKIGEHSPRWIESEVDAWINAKIQEARQ